MLISYHGVIKTMIGPPWCESDENYRMLMWKNSDGDKNNDEHARKNKNINDLIKLSHDYECSLFFLRHTTVTTRPNRTTRCLHGRLNIELIIIHSKTEYWIPFYSWPYLPILGPSWHREKCMIANAHKWQQFVNHLLPGRRVDQLIVIIHNNICFLE